jgi:hypothetical protein
VAEFNRLVVSRDGTLGFRAQQVGPGSQTLAFGEVSHLALIRNDHPGRPSRTISVIIAHGLTRAGVTEKLGLPEHDSIRAPTLIECALGEYLDNHGSLYDKSDSPTIGCNQELVAALTDREPAPDRVVRQYIKAKTWWAWHLDAPGHFTRADALRLGVSIRALRNWR